MNPPNERLPSPQSMPSRYPNGRGSLCISEYHSMGVLQVLQQYMEPLVILLPLRQILLHYQVLKFLDFGVYLEHIRSCN